MSVRILIGDCRERMADLPDASVDSVVTDPPYHLTSIVKRFGSATAAPAKVGKTGAYARASKGFMGQQWDGGDIAFQPELWAEVLRVLKPGGHMVAFSGTRTYHRMVCAIEDAGFEIRDQLAWVYGSGFPKSLDVSKAIDKAAGHQRGTTPDFRNGPNTRATKGVGKFGGYPTGQDETDDGPATDAAREWQGWGTALKPAWEPICLARKPLISTVAANVLAHGCGALNIDGCRVETDETIANHSRGAESAKSKGRYGDSAPQETHQTAGQALGRFPANLMHDGSDEVLAGFPETKAATSRSGAGWRSEYVGGDKRQEVATEVYADGGGSAARFFYCAKASKADRGEGNNHPTVKPNDLMRWLVRLITPPGGTVLDPFAGSGSTLLAATQEGMNAIGCELSEEYAAIAEGRVRASGGMFAEVRAA